MVETWLSSSQGTLTCLAPHLSPHTLEQKLARGQEKEGQAGGTACSPGDGRGQSPSSGTGWAFSPLVLGGSWLTGQEGQENWNRTLDP